MASLGEMAFSLSGSREVVFLQVFEAVAVSESRELWGAVENV